MPKKAVTIRDVARQAGVSVATASRALNGKDIVNPQTRDRIMTVMEELGFRPSPAARRLSLGRTLTVGVVVSFLTRPQAAERLRGVDAVLTDSEFDLVIYNVESVQKRDHYLGTLAQSQRTDGLIVMSLPPSAEAAASHQPVTRTGRVHRRPYAVRGRHAARRRGRRHRRARWPRAICSSSGTRRSPSSGMPSKTRSGSPRAVTASRVSPASLASAGVTIPTAWIGHGAHGRYEARDLAHRILTGERRPTAIFTASDTQALGVIAAARELDLHVPDDLSVIGYDDIEAADYVGLTTIRQQLFESGRRGAEVLLSEIKVRSEQPPVVQAGTRARGPGDHGASEGGPWMRAPATVRTRHGRSEQEDS